MSVAASQIAACREILETHARTFSLASRFLGRESADRAAIVYAWCRRADDAIDLVGPTQHAAALHRLEAELASIFAGEAQSEPVLAAFQWVCDERAIPPHYPKELLAGMRMDVEDVVYEHFDDLLLYCYRVAGVVGLMMAHVLGVRADAALPAAAHLGMAMQLTNIARDLDEDHQRGRCYLPVAMLGDGGVPRPPEPYTFAQREAMGGARLALLGAADAYYRSADRGLAALSWRSALGIRVARWGYAAIGDVIRRQGATRIEGRARVSRAHKLGIVLVALGRGLTSLPGRWACGFRPIVPSTVLEYRHVELPT